MINSSKAVVFPVLFLLIFTLFAGLAGRPQDVWATEQSQAAAGAEGAAAGESLSELKEKLWNTTDYQEIRSIVDTFKSMPGPDAAAAQVLLDYLKDSLRVEAGDIIGALVKLMTDEQVGQLARELETYNGANAYQYLVSVLAARLHTASDLTEAVLSLQKGYLSVSEKYLQYMQQAWPRIFTDPDEAVQWLDEAYAKLTEPMDRRSLVYAAGIVARQQPPGGIAGRRAITGWLWRVQEKEPDPVYRYQQFFTLYELGEARALGAIEDLYSGLASTGAKVDLIHRMGSSTRSQLNDADKDDLIEWLWKTAEKDASPYCRQESLAVLYTDLGQEKALEQYVRDTDQNGVAAFTEGDSTYQIDGSDWRLLRDAGQKYPQSFLGRGIKAYEAVRGQPYFEIDRPEESFEAVWAPPYGDEEYDPDREIPGWEKFLAAFPGHPAADDAAYRLARCYEIEGRFADAVNTMQKARFAPDGDMRYAADGRLVYILDVRMTYDQLKELSAEKLAPPLDMFVSYSLAVKEIRRGDFPQAAAGLEAFLKQEPDLLNGPGVLPFTHFDYYEKYDFRGSVEKQLDEVKKLADLQAQWEETKDPADLYALAAAIFHNEMLYYNHLWAGQRQYYNWLGYINASGNGHAPVEMAVFAREMINYNHSLPYFQQVYQDPSSPPELKARALYSTGLCYIGLEEWGEDASFAFNPSEIIGKIISTYQAFVKEYPASSMADDALLALGAYTGDAAYLQRSLEEYPESDTIEKAKNLIKEMESPYYRPVGAYGCSVPFKITSLDDEGVPREIKEWVAANAAQPFTGSKTSGAWSYLLMAAGEKPSAGYSMGIISIADSSDGLKVYYRVEGPPPGQVTAQVVTHPYILVRIPANKLKVEFVGGVPR